MNAEQIDPEKFNQYDIKKTIQSIWSEQDLETKKNRLVNEIIYNMRYKKEAPKFISRIHLCKDHKSLDQIITNIVLYGEGLNVIKI